MKAIVRVMPHNSTVNGHPAKAHHDARKWFDGWKNLAFKHRKGQKHLRIVRDGCARVLTGRQKINIFGAGRVRGLSCGEYLHVPLVGDEIERRRYRVRCRFYPGGKFRGQKVHSVSAVRRHGHWYWVIRYGAV